MFWSRKSGPNAKPSLHASIKNRRVLGLVLLGSAVFLSTLLRVSVKSKRLENRLRRRQANKFQCSNLQNFEICSHQLLNPPPGGGVDGSLKAMTSFWKNGIRCFDVDAVTLKDGTLLASHPSRFAARIASDSKSVKPEDYTLNEAREAGADTDAFPLLDSLLRHYASLVNDNAQAPLLAKKSKFNGLPGPLLNLDLKGPNFTAKLLQDIQKTVNEVGIRDNVALVVTSLKAGEVGPGVDMLQELGRMPSQGKLGLVLRDRETIDWDIRRIQSIVQENKAIQLYVASYKFEPEYFAKLRDMPVVVWTVDEEKALLHALKSGVAAAVSNHPLQLLPTLDKLLKEAKCLNY
jgi:glycerophosphoryl diester phosphodiesterase